MPQPSGSGLFCNTALVSTFRVCGQDTPSMRLWVAAGMGYLNGAWLAFAGTETPLFTAPDSQPRIDLVTLDAAGVVRVLAGAEAASPTPPSNIPTGQMPLAEVYHLPGETALHWYNKSDGSGYILRDRRPHFSHADGGGAGTSGAPTNLSYLTLNAEPALSNEIPVTALPLNLAIVGNQVAARTITLGGKGTFTDQVVIGGDILIQNAITPATTASKDLGSAVLKWRDVYLTGSLKDGTNSLTLANLATAYAHAVSTNNPHGTTLSHAQAAGGSITEAGIADGTILARLASDEAVTGSWDFSGGGLIAPNVATLVNAPENPAEGALVWAADTGRLYGGHNSAWQAITGTGGGGGVLDAEYLTLQSHPDLTNEHVAGSMAADLTLKGNGAAPRTFTLGGVTGGQTDLVALGGNCEVGLSLYPKTDNAVDLGAATLKWRDIHCAGSLTDGSNTLSLAQIAAGLGGGALVSPVVLTAGAANQVPFSLQGYANQSADLQQWQNSSGAVLAKIDAAGAFSLLEGGASPVRYTTIQTADQSADITYTLPPTQGGVGSYLSNDGAGNLSWGAGTSGSVTSPATITSGSAAQIPLSIVGAGSQSGDLQRWKSSSGTVLAKLTKAGYLGIGRTTDLNVALDILRAKISDGSGALYYQVAISDTSSYNSNPIAGILFGGKYNSTGTEAGFGGIAAGKENTTTGDYGSYLALYTRANGSPIAERLRIDSAGVVLIAGNLSVGSAGSNLSNITSADTLVANASAQNVTIGNGRAGAITIAPGYTRTGTQSATITRANYLRFMNPTKGSGVIITDGCLFEFDADAGTHAALGGATTKATPGAVNAWAIVNLNGTLGYMPIYLSKTA